MVPRPPRDEAALCTIAIGSPHITTTQREEHVKQRTLKKLSVVLGALLITGALAGTAAAVLTVDAGGAMLRVDKRTENVPSTTSATNWTNLPGAAIGVALLDQELLSGIGNVYKSEILFLAETSPFAAIQELDVSISA